MTSKVNQENIPVTSFLGLKNLFDGYLTIWAFLCCGYVTNEVDGVITN